MSLKCLHGRMKQIVRMAIYHQFSEKTSALFSTDVASRGLDFSEVDWVVQVDCPEDVPTYRVGRISLFSLDGKSVLFLLSSEKEMVTKLQAAEPKIPIQLIKVKLEKCELISEVQPSMLAKYPNINNLAKRAFITYLKSVKKRCDKEVFDVNNLPIEEYAASLGLVTVPTMRFMKGKMNSEKVSKGAIHQQEDGFDDEDVTEDDDILLEKKSCIEVEKPEASLILEKKLKCVKEDKKGAENQKMAPKVKKKKMKINLHQPPGTRLKFDEDGDTIPPLAAAIADTKSGGGMLQIDKERFASAVRERYNKLKEEMKKRDKEDKLLHRQRLHEMRIKEKAKMKRHREEAEAGMVESQSDVDVHDEEAGNGFPKWKKIYYDNDDDEDGEMKGKKNVDHTSMSTAEQEDLALKLLSSLHS